MVYMPTIALNNTISFRVLEQQGMNFIQKFPPIRVWGTVGFIVAMWCTDLSGSNLTTGQLHISVASALLLGLYGFTLPACPPARDAGKRSVAEALGLDAFVLFRRAQMVIFFLCAMLLGGALQITNAFGSAFLADFAGTYPDSFGVRNSNILISISQISETLFILTIPYFLQRFGIKAVMLIAILAWVLRFGLFAYGDPGPGLWMLVLSMIVYGMAFDFFNISGAMFVNLEANARIRASAQGLFMVMTNGLGAFLGTMVAGGVVDHYTVDGVRDWQSIWLTFAGYALALGAVFPFVFRYRHDAAKMTAAATAH
jgi:NHS family xanthosine MFS transporter